MSGYSHGAARIDVADNGQQASRNLSVREGGLESPPNVNGKRIRQIVALRRLRQEVFTGSHFADAAWDILLALYAAHLDQHRLSISKLTSRSGVAGTTALRWIGSLEAAGLLTRTPDTTDNRRVFVALSGQGAQSMNGYFATCGADVALL